MKRITQLFKALTGLTLLVILFPSQAHAYLDPGTGSYVFQLLLAAVVGALFAVRIFWGRIKAFVRKLFLRETGTSQDEE